MWDGSHFEPFEAGTLGKYECCPQRIFVEPSIFTDLTQGVAVINEKNLPVEIHDATLEEEAEINGEMYVFCIYFVTNDNDLSAQVLKLINKSTAIICLWKVSHQLSLLS